MEHDIKPATVIKFGITFTWSADAPVWELRERHEGGDNFLVDWKDRTFTNACIGGPESGDTFQRGIYIALPEPDQA